jgi:hypothetical protein
MEKEKMLKRISELETINDQLLTELNYLDQLLKQIGFEQGLITLKAAAHELIEEENQKEEKMLKRISELETINDQLLTELNYLDQLLKQIGFEQGLMTLKAAAHELIEEENQKEERN